MDDDRLRHAPPALSRLVALALVALVAFVGACDKLEWKPLALPGFSVDAPTWLKAPANAPYRGGQIQAQRGTKLVSITWQTGEALTAEEMPATLELAMKQVAKGEHFELGQATSVTIGGQKATQLEARSGEVHALYVDINCGRRSVMIGIVGTSQFAALRDRILASFRCTPIEAEEKALENLVPIGADDPTAFAGWHYADDDRSVFAITDDSLYAIFAESPELDVSDAQLKTILPQFFELGGTSFAASPTGSESRKLADGTTRTFDRGEMTADGDTLPAVMTFWRCRDGQRLVIAIVVAAEPDALTGAIDWLSRLRCSQPGDQITFEAPPTAEEP